LAEGAKDYTRKVILIESENIFGKIISVGNAELAARLGSPVTYDRRGQVVFWDTFGCGLAAWNKVESGTGAEVVLTADQFEREGYSARLTAGSDGAAYAEINKRIPVLSTSTKMGLEWAFAVNGTPAYIQGTIDVVTGGTLIGAGVRYDPVNYLLQCKTGATTWTTFATNVVLQLKPTYFHRAKFVVDIANQVYIRAMVDGVEYDLSAYTPHVTTTIIEDEALVAIGNYGQGGDNPVVYLDTVILTVQEPAS